MKKQRDFGPWPALIAGAGLGVGGWALLIDLLGRWPVSPERDWRFLFLSSLWLGVTGTALPLVWLLQRRFGRPDAATGWHPYWVQARRAAWVGSWVALCALLQMHRLLNWAMALLLQVVLVLLEALLSKRREAEQEV